jgi:hypothetical protein
MTAGTHPYAWLRSHVTLMIQRRRSVEPVLTLPGLLNKHVLEAAVLDGQRIPWSVLPDVPGLSTSALEEGARGVMEACLAATPSDRPKLPALLEMFKYDARGCGSSETLPYHMRLPTVVVMPGAGLCTVGSRGPSRRP